MTTSGNGLAYSLAEVGAQEPGPVVDSAHWLSPEELTPELLAQLHQRSQRLKHPSEWEQRHQAWLDELGALSDVEFEKRYF